VGAALVSVTAVLFDFDMTLVDSGVAVTECMNMMADAVGCRRVTRDEMLSVIGKTLEDEWRLLWGRCEPGWLDFYRSNFVDAEFGLITRYEGTRPALSELREMGIKVGVVSNRKYARRAVDICGIADLCDVAIGLEDVTNPKPHPDALLLALERLGASRSEAMYVGDTDIDIKTAEAAGVFGVGVTTGSFDSERLTAAGAALVCSDLRELPEFIKNI
jgi:HAD superfamily hydrolase (TIGR01509 family)